MTQIALIPCDTLYESDEHVWIARQIAALRTADVPNLDRRNLIEYLLDMTQRDVDRMESALRMLFQHLLKVQFQPGRVTRSGRATIIEQAARVRSLLRKIPSLAAKAEEVAEDAYRDATNLAAAETGLDRSRFPAQRPWTVSQAFAIEPPPPNLS